MFDISVEEPIRLHEAARIAGTGKRGRPIHPSTVFRWIWDGVRGPGGELVRLEGLRIGKHWATSKQALQRFFEELTPEVADGPNSAILQQVTNGLAVRMAILTLLARIE